MTMRWATLFEDVSEFCEAVKFSPSEPSPVPCREPAVTQAVIAVVEDEDGDEDVYVVSVSVCLGCEPQLREDMKDLECVAALVRQQRWYVPAAVHDLDEAPKYDA